MCRPRQNSGLDTPQPLRFDGCPAPIGRRLLSTAVRLSVASCAIVAFAANAADPGWTGVGARAGLTDSVMGENLNQFEVTATYGLPWDWSLGSGWMLGTRLDTTIGALHGGGETGAVLSVGPALAFAHPGQRFAIELGISPTLLSRHEYGDADLGGNIQFTSFLGLSYRVSERLEVNGRIQHMSNAGISEPNPGLDQIALGFRYLLDPQ